jgi:hypothetical protein
MGSWAGLLRICRRMDRNQITVDDKIHKTSSNGPNSPITSYGSFVEQFKGCFDIRLIHGSMLSGIFCVICTCGSHASDGRNGNMAWIWF